MTRCRGFSLIELTVVLVIMALLSAVVSVSLANIGRRALVSDAVDTIADMDRSLRTECLDYDREGRLRFDLDSGVIGLSVQRGQEWIDTQVYAIPVGMTLTWVRVASEDNKVYQSGAQVIGCDRQGRTQTYAFGVAPVTSGDAGGRINVVAGLTGQVWELEDEAQVAQLFTVLSSGNAD